MVKSVEDNETKKRDGEERKGEVRGEEQGAGGKGKGKEKIMELDRRTGMQDR